jgi:hypothetical protein
MVVLPAYLSGMASAATTFSSQPLRKILRKAPKVFVSRSLSTTTSLLAARPRPAPKRPKLAPHKQTFDESAKKAGVLKIEPSRALEILRRYAELSDNSPNRKWEKDFCVGKSRDQCDILPRADSFVEEKITPADLHMLSKIVMKGKGAASWSLGSELMYSASANGDPEATIVVIEYGLEKGNLNRPEFVDALANLRKMAAAPQLCVEAMNVLGEVYELANQEEKALQLYRQAVFGPQLLPKEGNRVIGGKGPGYSHVKIGTILLRRFDRSGAESHFRKAALEFDHPLGHYHLAQLEKPNSKIKETSLLKVASTGFLKAAADLGQLYITRANSTAAQKKDEKAIQLKLAKEWLYLASTAGDGRGMLDLAQAFKDEGSLESGLKWLEMAEKHKDTEVAKEAAKMRAIF